MVMPSSTPRLLGNFTWKVPLLGMTDSVNQQPWVTQEELRDLHLAPAVASLGLGGKQSQRVMIQTIPPRCFQLMEEEG